MSETWFFDRLGENSDVPPITVTTDADLRDKLRQHAREHTVAAAGYRVNGIYLRYRRFGGFDILDSETQYQYGTARKGPVFVEAPEIPKFTPPPGFAAPR